MAPFENVKLEKKLEISRRLCEMKCRIRILCQAFAFTTIPTDDSSIQSAYQCSLYTINTNNVVEYETEFSTGNDEFYLKTTSIELFIKKIDSKIIFNYQGQQNQLIITNVDSLNLNLNLLDTDKCCTFGNCENLLKKVVEPINYHNRRNYSIFAAENCETIGFDPNQNIILIEKKPADYEWVPNYHELKNKTIGRRQFHAI